MFPFNRSSRSAPGGAPLPHSRQAHSRVLTFLTDPNSHYIAPPSLGHVPHAVIHDRVVASITATNTTEQVVFFGAWGHTLHTSRYAAIACRGTFAEAPFAGSSSTWGTTNLSSSDACRFRLASMRVRVTAQPSVSGLFPGGTITVCALPTTIDLNSFATWADVATFVKSRVAARSFSAARLMSGAIRYLIPNDLITNFSLEPNAGAFSANTAIKPDDGWGQLVYVLEGVPADSPTTLTFTVHTAWSVEYTKDPVKQSIHTRHPSAGEGVWSAASTVAGDLADAAEEAVGGAAGALATLMGLGGAAGGAAGGAGAGAGAGDVAAAAAAAAAMYAVPRSRARRRLRRRPRISRAAPRRGGRGQRPRLRRR